MTDAELLQQLADIQGLDAIGWWPLAPAWWVLIALALSALLVMLVRYLRERAYWRSWKGQTARVLDAMNARLAPGQTREIAGELSVLLRRIALQCFPRPAVAGLEGAAWLDWLTAKDPHNFDWSANGAILNEAPYAPPTHEFAPESLRPLISAARKWVER